MISKRSVSIFFILVFLFANIFFVSAQPPQSTQVVLNLDSGLNIEVPRIGTLQQNKDFLFAFHVYNISSGIRLDNSSTNCSFELFQHNGTHQFEIELLEFVENEWEVLVTGGNFSRVGKMYYISDCISPSEGGVIAVPIHVSSTGTEFSTSSSISYGFLLLILLLINFLFFYIIASLDIANFRDDENEIVQINLKKYVKIVLIALAYGLILLTLSLMETLALSIGVVTQFSGIIGGIFNILLRLAWPWTVIIIIWIGLTINNDSHITKLIKEQFEEAQNSVK